MSVADDEQRLIRGMARALRSCAGHTDTDWGWEQFARTLKARLADQRITLTPLPAPDPTYTWRMDHNARRAVMRALAEAGEKDWWDTVNALQPDEVPS